MFNFPDLSKMDPRTMAMLALGTRLAQQGQRQAPGAAPAGLGNAFSHWMQDLSSIQNNSRINALYKLKMQEAKQKGDERARQQAAQDKTIEAIHKRVDAGKLSAARAQTLIAQVEAGQYGGASTALAPKPSYGKERTINVPGLGSAIVQPVTMPDGSTKLVPLARFPKPTLSLAAQMAGMYGGLGAGAGAGTSTTGLTDKDISAAAHGGAKPGWLDTGLGAVRGAIERGLPYVDPLYKTAINTASNEMGAVAPYIRGKEAAGIVGGLLNKGRLAAASGIGSAAAAVVPNIKRGLGLNVTSSGPVGNQKNLYYGETNQPYANLMEKFNASVPGAGGAPVRPPAAFYLWLRQNKNIDKRARQDIARRYRAIYDRYNQAQGR